MMLLNNCECMEECEIDYCDCVIAMVNLLYKKINSCYEEETRRLTINSFNDNFNPFTGVLQWHIDGYDKLKPYGICISGCIDGFSRKMIWLNTHSTNSDPRLIAGYFIDSVMQHGRPLKVRLDHGTENTHIAAMQSFMHGSENGISPDCVTLGPSTGNQRIERWWCTADFYEALFLEFFY